MIQEAFEHHFIGGLGIPDEDRSAAIDAMLRDAYFMGAGFTLARLADATTQEAVGETFDALRTEFGEYIDELKERVAADEVPTGTGQDETH